MNLEILSNELFDAITNSCYRSIIVNKMCEDCLESKLYTITKVDEGVYYVTLSDNGVVEILVNNGVTNKDARSVLEFIKNREKEQVKALVSYLKLERELQGSVVFIILRDGRVDIDDNMFKKAYNLPLSVLFKSISDSGFKPIRTDVITSSDLVTEEDYAKHLFANKMYNGLLSVFIDVTE